MRMGSSKIVLFTLCLAVCVGMCRPLGDDTTAASPAPTDESGSFSKWAYDKFSHVFGGKQEEPELAQTQNFQIGFGSGLFGSAPVEAPAPGPDDAFAPGPATDAAQSAFSYGKDKAEEALGGAKDTVEGAYNSAKKTVTN